VIPLGWYSGGNATPLCSRVCHFARMVVVVVVVVAAAVTTSFNFI
jgi:hypothetical protein